MCFASHAGYTEYSGLPGKVCTGCPNTPDYSSRYRKIHKPTVATPQVSEQGTDDHPPKSLVQEDQVGLIISKSYKEISSISGISNSKSCTYAAVFHLTIDHIIIIDNINLVYVAMVTTFNITKTILQ